ncbi:MAG: flagellar protein, partial [Candidatus Kapaibacterium sp.]
MELNGIQLPFVPVTGGSATVPTPQVSSPARTPFADILSTEMQNIKFSSHAQARLSSRDISLSDEDVRRLESAVSKASDKGAKDSLVMLRDMAFIVS